MRDVGEQYEFEIVTLKLRSQLLKEQPVAVLPADFSVMKMVSHINCSSTRIEE